MPNRLNFNRLRSRDSQWRTARDSSITEIIGPAFRAPRVKRVQVRLGYRGDSQVYAFASPADPAEISFAQVAALTEARSPAGAEYLALMAGGTFVPVAPRQHPLGELTADAIKESSEACAELVRATSDQVLSPAEAREALPEIEEAIRRFVQLHTAVAARAREGGGK